MSHHRVRNHTERFVDVVMEDRRPDRECDGDECGAAGEDHEQLSRQKLPAEAAAERLRLHPGPMR